MTALPSVAYRGLAPTREVLPNGVTVLSKSTAVTPAVTLNASIDAWWSQWPGCRRPGERLSRVGARLGLAALIR